MISISKEPLEYVLSKYNIDVIKIRNESYKEKKGVWWIHTPDGFKVLKKVSNSEDTLRYIISAVYHLCDNGVKIPTINKTKDGNDYVKTNGSCYVLSDAAKGKNPLYKVDKEFKIVCTEKLPVPPVAGGAVQLYISETLPYIETLNYDDFFPTKF